MVLSNHELDRIAEDIYRDRRIRSSIHCAKCAYNLRTLPYVYSCPECGQPYNARPGSMKGILISKTVGFPVGHALAAALFLIVTIPMVWAAFSAPTPMRIALSVAFGTGTTIILLRTIPLLREFSEVRRLARSIVEEAHEANGEAYG